jgi:prepilin signal peptidase PulO-like enzyme (type II secretory pathway)
METSFLILAVIFGTLIGSFLNVVAARYNTGMGLGGRSKCFSCSKTLTWIELIPILSFLAQGAACKRCKSRISWQYPIVEAGVGILFGLIFWYFPPVSVEAAFTTLFYLIITSLLVVITVYDAKHKIIPDPLVFSFAALAFLRLFVAPDLSFAVPGLWQLLAGPLLALPFALLWVVSKGRWMGLGDAKLILGIGWVLGISAGISAVILAFWIGAIISVFWMYVAFRKFKTRYEIPFGPYLILGMYLVLFWQIHVFDTQAFALLFQ